MERLDNLGIELLSGVSPDLRERFVDGHWRAIRARSEHRVERIRDADNSCGQWNVESSESGGISATVVSLVMMEHDLSERCEGSQRFDDGFADPGMLLHLGVLVSVAAEGFSSVVVGHDEDYVWSVRHVGTCRQLSVLISKEHITRNAAVDRERDPTEQFTGSAALKG